MAGRSELGQAERRCRGRLVKVNSPLTKNTAMNPDVLGAFALAIFGGEDPPAFPGLPGHQPDLDLDRRHARIKKKYDPNGLFFVHHGDWSADGFTRLSAR
jgi:hypothetical protein